MLKKKVIEPSVDLIVIMLIDLHVEYPFYKKKKKKRKEKDTFEGQICISDQIVTVGLSQVYKICYS